MMSSTFGAPFGGTTRGAHQGVDSEALSLMTPPKGGLGGGSCLPSIVVVASGEPRTPVTCWAKPSEGLNARATADTAVAKTNGTGFIRSPSHVLKRPARPIALARRMANDD